MSKPIDWSQVAKDIAERQSVIASGKTPKQVAALLGGADNGWTGKKIRRLLRGGKLAASQDSQGRWFFNDDQLQAVVDYATGKKS